MRTILSAAFCILVACATHAKSPTPEKSFTTVRATITDIPEPFTFPGCDCGEHAKPYTCEVTEIMIEIPEELNGKILKLYHPEKLPADSVWKRKGSVLQFSIEAQALGSLYPEKDKRHTYSVPYSSYIKGDPKIIHDGKGVQPDGPANPPKAGR